MSQLDGKWIKDNTVEDNHVRLRNDQCLRGRNVGDSGDVQILKVNASDTVEFCTQPQFNGTPTVNNDLVNRGYVLDVLAGLRDPKDACFVASTTNIDLATGGNIVVDGLAAFTGARVLVKDQTNQAENGIYIASAGAWTRSTDADTVAELSGGASTLILEGTLNARKLYVMQYDIATIDVDPVVFVQAPNPANFLVPRQAEFTLAAGDITNGYIDLAHAAEAESIKVTPLGGPKQQYNTDYTVTVVGNVSRVTFAGDLATRAAAGDVLLVDYSYATS